MNLIRTLIVDDEPPARLKLRNLLATEADIELCGEAGNGEEAMRLIGEQRPDLLFLDVQMPAPDGIAVLRAVREEWLPCTIFTTAHAEHAVEAFALHAIDYLLKPYSRDRFAAALARARTTLAVRNSPARDGVAAFLNDPRLGPAIVERFLVKTTDRYIVVRAAEIAWIEAAANYVVLHTASGNHILRRSLSAIEGELDPHRFFRASRSTIVSLDQVREVRLGHAGEYRLLLQDGTEVPLTRGLREFQERFQVAR